MRPGIMIIDDEEHIRSSLAGFLEDSRKPCDGMAVPEYLRRAVRTG